MSKIRSTSFWSLLLLLAGIGWNAPAVQAQAITFSYIFDGQVLTGTSSLSGATANNATYGAGLGTKTFFAGNPGDAVAGDGFAAGTPLNTANNDYFGFSFTASSCTAVTLTGVSFDARRSGTGPANLEIRYSSNGFASALFSGALSSTNFESKSGSLASLVIAAGQTVEFRLYGYNASGTTGTLRVDNVRFSGALATSGPTAFAVTGGGAICLPAGAPVGLANSQAGVNYQLKFNGSPIGTPLVGTGSAISFGDQTGFGTYTVTATNTNGCTTNQTGSATISQSANCGGCALTLNTTQTDVLCNGNATGAIDLTPSGGTSAYTYLWTGGATSQDRTNLAAGTYTVTVTDANNCTKTTAVTIAQPTALALSATVVNPSNCLIANGSIDLNVSGGAGSYTYDWSNDGPESPDNDPQDLLNLPEGIFTVTVTDANGCTATRSNTLDYIDVLKPAITCPANVTVASGADCSGVLGSYAPASLSDNCTVNPGVVQSPVSGTVLNSANPTQVVTLTATDEAGNTQTCSFTVSLVDLTKPTLICPGNQTVSASAACGGTVGAWSPLSVGDNCGGLVSVVQNPVASTPLSGHDDFETVTLTATDASNNTQTCSFTVTLKDVIKPSISCPADVTINADVNCSGVIGAYAPTVLSDNCTALPTVTQSPEASTSLTGHNTSSIVTLTATDAAGNTQTCTLTVTLKDVTPATLVCKTFTADLNAAGNASITAADVYQSGADNCGAIVLVSVSPSTFNCSNIGANQVNLTATDGNGNKAECTSTVTVRDVTPPTVKCKDATVSLDINGNATVSAATINGGTTDNCSFTLNIAPATFNCANIGPNTVTLRATDASGNSAACTATVMVKDLTGPTAKCKNATIYLDDNGQATLSTADVNSGSSDACGLASMSINLTQFNCSHLPGSSWPVTLRLTDIHGNVSSCLANVAVKELIAPTAICENITVALSSNGKATVYGADLAFNSYDNCSVWSYSPVAKVYTAANLGPNNLTVTVKDWSGNATACVSVVTVVTGNGALQQGGNGTDGSAGIFDVKVYPNPTIGEAVLALQLPADQTFTYRIFDTSGRMMYSQNGVGVEGENIISLPVADFAPGLYLIDFQSESRNAQQRLMIGK